MLSRRRDAGWGWLVLLVVTLSQMIVGGSCLTGGVLYVIFSNAIDSSPVTLSWLCALPISTWFFGAPIGSFFTNKFGCRMCAMIGGIISSTGLSVGFFAQNVNLLFFSYGVLTGIGCGISYTAFMSAINQYFHKYKTLATGLTSIGHNAGLVVYSKLILELDQKYSWNGTMLILGAISFHTCVFAACLAPVEEDGHSERREIQKSNGIYKPIKVIRVSKDGIQTLQTDNTCDIKAQSQKENNTLSSDLNENIKIDAYIQNKGVSEKPMEASQSLIDSKTGNKTTKTGFIDWSLFRKPSFALFCTSNVLTNISQGVYILHLPSFTKGAGFTNDGIAEVMTVYGLVNVFGKVVYSVLGQHPKVNSTLVYSLSLAVTGLSMGLTPVFQTEPAVFTLAAFVGFFYCVTGALLQAVIYNIVGYERFPDGVGLSSPFKAIGNLIGGPVAGFILQISGTYDISFYLACLCLILAAACLTPAIIKEHRRARQDRRTLEVEVPSPKSTD